MKSEHDAAFVTVPGDLAEEIDAIVGEPARVTYIVAALREKVARDKARGRQTEALAGLRGALRDVPTPDWGTPDQSSQWVHDLRRADRRDAAG